MIKQKNRRTLEYGYTNIQPIIDRIYSKNFVVRLLATAEVGNSRIVRAYESVWNTECNNKNGCIEKQ